ncbi:hypothetical protein Hanom_Chr15g01366611 [Helianthus anomalus]
MNHVKLIFVLFIICFSFAGTCFTLGRLGQFSWSKLMQKNPFFKLLVIYEQLEEGILLHRKAPVVALGFRVQCNKWAVIVRLLLGEIPERTVFMQKGMEKALRPYFELTNV